MFSVKIKLSFIVFAVTSVLFLDLKIILCAIIGMGVHEAAHIVCAKIFGYGVRSMELCAQGLTIDLEGKPTGYKNIVILLAGPMSNLLISAVLMASLQDSSALPITFNLSFGLFNLIPLKFLDGGRILEELLDLCLPSRLAMRICHVVNVIMLCVTWCVSIYCFLFESAHSSSMFICIFSLINLCLDDSF